MTAAGGRAHRLATCGGWATPAPEESMTAAGGQAHRLVACGSWAAPAGGLERVSATTLSTPGAYSMSLVYSAMKLSCLC